MLFKWEPTHTSPSVAEISSVAHFPMVVPNPPMMIHAPIFLVKSRFIMVNPQEAPGAMAP